ncbi:hypothetical protein A3J34_01990 [Candidatus Peribacteria bacterium RIFCSPLOWO2_02_FULL_51_10]|nr:MAG: hypothetical protein A3C52_02005 [Candidatus Peribacteria bacterium RIFCSPHIGHO2_02_FULL_51_15]OGJ69133.1 MAG: hypothetical protein A3J34_01990 [Candidatus Peribacteria bacterium RIFCSPLOWO2_02_FULL_51_10]
MTNIVRIPSMPQTRTPAQTLVVAYTLLLGLLFFLWPVALGIHPVFVQLIWIAITLPLIIVSSLMLEKSLAGVHIKLPEIKKTPWTIIVIILLAISIPLFTVPYHTFSDEINLALPALTFLSHVARFITWPIVLIVFFLSCFAFLCLIRKLPVKFSRYALLPLALAACLTAALGPVTALAIRYPPLIHLVQSTATVLVLGDIRLLRAGTLIWTLILFLAVFHFLPYWNRLARIGTMFAFILSPLGWFYHTSLYQAAAEMTMGFLATIVLAEIISKPKTRAAPGLAGVIFALWILERPTSIVALVTACVLLFLLNKRREAWQIGSVAAPVAVAWAALYPFYGYDFLLQKGNIFPAASQHEIFKPLSIFFISLPQIVGAIPLVILILGSLVLYIFGERREKIFLSAAWVITLSVTLAQQMILPPELFGYARYAVLLMLPLAIVTGSFLSGNIRIGSWSKPLGIIFVILFIVSTPFDVVTFMQNNRINPGASVYRTTSTADIAQPIQSVAEKILKENPGAVVLAPDLSFLDLFIPAGIISPAQRSRIINRSRIWTPEDPTRPVMIQSPVLATYQPNTTPEQENRLRDARVWALKQPGNKVFKLGIEETVVVR